MTVFQTHHATNATTTQGTNALNTNSTSMKIRAEIAVRLVSALASSVIKCHRGIKATAWVGGRNRIQRSTWKVRHPKAHKSLLRLKRGGSDAIKTTFLRVWSMFCFRSGRRMPRKLFRFRVILPHPLLS